MEAVQTQAPAPTEPTTQPAAIQAVQDQNFHAFRDAERAKEAGKPLPDAPIAAAEEADDEPAPAAAAPERTLSKRQIETNEKIRLAVERATSELKAENDRLKTSAPKPAAEAVAPAAAPTQQDYKRILALPGAPKDSEFDSLAELQAATAVFVYQTLAAEQTQRDVRAKATESAVAAELAKVTTFQTRITEAGGKPFLDALTADVRDLRPVEAMQAQAQQLHAAGDTAGAQKLLASVGARHHLTSEIVKSAYAPQLLKHLSDHPDDLAAFDALTYPADVIRAVGRLEARLDTPEPAALTTKTVTSMSAPPKTLTARGSAPADATQAALNTGNFRAFQAAERQREQSRRNA